MLAGLVALLLSSDCAECHKAQVAALAASRHATAAKEPIFTVSFANARTPWCLECHQPERTKAPGLTCLTCHRVKGDKNAVIGAHPPRLNDPKVHPVVVDPTLATSSCIVCHEFNSPFLESVNPVILSTKPMQTTVSDMTVHDPNANCTDCHDAHLPHGAHDPATLRKSLQISAKASDGGTEIEISAKGMAHRFPSGDTFRRLILSVCADEACKHELAQETLGPYFVYREDVWSPLFDKTLRDGEKRTFRLPAARYWRARFYFGNPNFERGLKPIDILDDLGGGEVPGWVAPPAPAPPVRPLPRATDAGAPKAAPTAPIAPPAPVLEKLR